MKKTGWNGNESQAQLFEALEAMKPEWIMFVIVARNMLSIIQKYALYHPGIYKPTLRCPIFRIAGRTFLC